MSSSILVVVAHPDDEVLGCGGTIAKHVQSGDHVHLLIMADGVTARETVGVSELHYRKLAMRKAQSILGISSVISFELPDNQLDTISMLSLVQKLEKVISQIQPMIVYTHHSGDLNIDHQRTHFAVLTACRPLPGSSIREIYGFEVLSSTEWAGPQACSFIPTVYVDISAQLEKKLAAAEAYSLEMRLAPHSRSIEHIQILAKHRGFSCGIMAAEAFVAYRIIKTDYEL